MNIFVIKVSNYFNRHIITIIPYVIFWPLLQWVKWTNEPVPTKNIVCDLFWLNLINSIIIIVSNFIAIPTVTVDYLQISFQIYLLITFQLKLFFIWNNLYKNTIYNKLGTLLKCNTTYSV